MFKKLALNSIRLYQKTLSLDHGPLKRHFPNGYCKFEPSCSMYTYQAIDRFGVIKGVGLGTWRIMRCNPWTKGGADPVPVEIPNNKNQITNKR